MAESSVIAIATEIIFTPMCARGREDAARQSAVDNSRRYPMRASGPSVSWICKWRLDPPCT
jgi:hypothetical protein